MAFLRRRYGARLFFIYFQAFTSTYAPASVLRDRYDEAIAAARRVLARGLAQGSPDSDPSDQTLRYGREEGDCMPAIAGDGLRGLVVSTRPDCVDESVVDLLASYAERGLELWVELGLQSAHDRTLRAIGRGHDRAAFERAVRFLEGRGTRIAAHVILGLPGEGRADMIETAREVAALGLDGVKFHDLRILSGTRLEREYLAGEIAPMHPTRLPGILADCIEELPPGCEVMRLCADAPAAATIVPRRPPDKAALYRAVEDELASRGTRQGAGFGRAR